MDPIIIIALYNQNIDFKWKGIISTGSTRSSAYLFLIVLILKIFKSIPKIRPMNLL